MKDSRSSNYHMELKSSLVVLSASLALVLVGVGCSGTPEAGPSAVTGNDAPAPVMDDGSAMMEDTSDGITMEEVAMHDTPDDCWMVVDGKVVDGAKAVGFHSKLKDKFLENCGSDATDAFMTRGKEPPNPHPESANDVLESIYLGELVE